MKNIIVLGGNGFIGYETVKSILSEHQGAAVDKSSLLITIINRGKSTEWQRLKTLQDNPHLQHIKWDRDKPLGECQELTEKFRGTQEIQAVIDFSGYKKSAVKESIKYFQDKAKLYIYLSSDSVYEVCRQKSHISFTKETDATRPETDTEQKKLKRKDSYGHKKLAAEECFLKYCKTNMKYVILRLADVIGFGDTTDRWWQYQLWIHLAIKLKVPIYLPTSLHHTQISLVYVQDVARLIAFIISMSEDRLSKLSKQAFNLAFNETVTVEELVRLIEREIKKARYFKSGDSTGKNISVLYSKSSDVPHIYPSVDRGPVCIDKARELLHWEPTSLETAVFQIVNEYEVVHDTKAEYNAEKMDIAESLCKDLKGVYNEKTRHTIQCSLYRILNLEQIQV